MKKKKEKKRVIIYMEGIYSKEQIKNWENDHPGEKLAFHIRHSRLPYYSMLVDGILLIIFMVSYIIKWMI